MTQVSGERFNLKDGMQPVTFEGKQLAYASSQSDDHPQPRWTELAIYKTATGKYVLEKIGRSDLFHTATCDKFGKGAIQYADIIAALEDTDENASEDDLEQYFVPCEVCKPSFDSDAQVVVEQDFHKVERFETPEQLIEELYRRRPNGVRALSMLSRNLLDMAALKDEGIKAERSKPIPL